MTVMERLANSVVVPVVVLDKVEDAAPLGLPQGRCRGRQLGQDHRAVHQRPQGRSQRVSITPSVGWGHDPTDAL